MKRTLILHPFLLSVYPVLFLFAHNIEHFLLNEILMPIALVTGLALLSWLLLSLVLKSREKAGLLVSLALFLFFSYGHFYNSLGGIEPVVMFGRHKILIAAGGILFALGTYFSVKAGGDLRNITSLLNVVAASLVIISLVSIGAYVLETRAWQGYGNDRGPSLDSIHPDDVATLPDIYYVILDGYARDDILREMYQYDNAEFLNYLIQSGFYIARESRSNYAQTSLSLASSLNMVYLDELVNRVGEESDNRVPLEHMIKNSEVRDFLEQYGYKFVAFSSGYEATEIRSADVYLTTGWSLSEFQNVLLNTTPIPVILEKLLNRSQHDLHRDRILYILDHLADTTQTDSPVFTFAHIIAPHPPFVFGERGEPVQPNDSFALADGAIWTNSTSDEYVEYYRAQLAFVSDKVEEAMGDILSNLSEPVIIIIQADHGPGSMLDWENPSEIFYRERMSILNAYYFYDGDYTSLYNGITPVNTFRLVLGQYFGASYDLVQDESYFSGWSRPYRFTNVTSDAD